MFIASALSRETKLTTNSPVSRMFASVSLGWPGARLPMLMPTVGGSPASTLKNETGAALTSPAALRVTTQAIGRGVTVEVSSL